MSHHLAILGFLVLCACGGADPKSAIDDGYQALMKGDRAGALQAFDATLAGLDAHHPEYRRAALGRCEALAVLDAAQAKSAFLELAQTKPELVKENDYSLMCSALLGADANLEAIHVMQAGRDRFVGSANMELLLESVINASQRAETPEAMQELEKMGYIGKGSR